MAVSCNGISLPVYVRKFESSGRFESPPSQIVWSMNLADRSDTALHRSLAYSALLSVGLYEHPMTGSFRSLQLTEAATNFDMAVVSTSDMSRSYLAMMATPPWLLLGLSFLATIYNLQVIPLSLQLWG